MATFVIAYSLVWLALILYVVRLRLAQRQWVGAAAREDKLSSVAE
jgi:hypothetical protein